MKPRVGILGATGYTGAVLTKLLMKHPFIDLTYLSSEQNAGKNYFDIYRNFTGHSQIKLKPVDLKEIAKSCDILFLATPNGFSEEFLVKLLSKNSDIKTIDLSADLRLRRELKVNKTFTAKIAYGLPEIHRQEIKRAQIIANPGCYPTSAILGLAPAINKGWVDLSSIIIDSKSGASGAGKQLRPDLLFCEINESFSPYNLAGKHRHIPEIENELLQISKAGKKFNVVFSPHLLPINRGILSTIYVELVKKVSQESLNDVYKNYYKNEYFVKVLPETVYANTKNVRYTNFCHITPLLDVRTNRLIIVSSIDNMVKGASGQAIQNMNIILSIDEKTGLDAVGQIP